ncbi:MAG: hypothetical protein RBT80_26045, partial [Candidatus Vecturithrix sp.]|nr:hypothetical protein [Candidatus Vecturithrix sp.]
YQLIANVDELRQRLLTRDFDLMLLSDYDAQLFQYHAQRPFQKVKSWLSLVRIFRFRGMTGTMAHFKYLRALPFSLAELNSFAPVIVVDLTDSPLLTPKDQRVLRDCSLYFKREVPFDRLFLYYQDRPAPWTTRRKELLPILEKVQNIPLGIEDAKYAALKQQRVTVQDIDVLFVGEITNTLRKTGMEHLQELASNSQWNIVITRGLPFDEYCRMIARSKITVSIAGGGWDCFRHYEAVALGSLPLMNKPTIDAVWWHPMPEEIFFENTFVNFRSRIEQLLTNDSLRTSGFEQLEQQVEHRMLHSKIIEYIIKTSLEKLSCQTGSLSTTM